MHKATAAEMERLDELAVASGLEIRQMMELAGWHMRFVFDDLTIDHAAPIAIVCGTGNKGGDGLAAARHLINHGFSSISVVLMREEVKLDAAHHLALLEQMGVPIAYGSTGESWIRDATVVIDALIGYHLDGPPRGIFAETIEQIRVSDATVIAYDIPSGIDATSGQCLGPCIQADATLTLALAKRGLLEEEGKQHSGTIYLADIGIPAFLYHQIAAKSRPSFPAQGVLRI